MSDLARFFDRLDEQAHDVPHDELVDDDRLQDAADLALPTFTRWAERAGVDLSHLADLVHERTSAPVDVIEARLGNGDDVDVNLRMLAGACGLQFFLAGVLWEQDRHMPDLEISEGE